MLISSFENADSKELPKEEFAYDIGNMPLIEVNSKEIEYGAKGSTLVNLFAEAIKGPLLSSESIPNLNSRFALSLFVFSWDLRQSDSCRGGRKYCRLFI